LRRRAEFLRCYEAGRRGHGSLSVVFCRARGDAEPWRLGLTATRKVGNAVVRNRLRRRVREFFRRQGDGLPPGWDFVVNLKGGAVRATSHDLNRDLDRILRGLGFNVVSLG
jgi:ribonuclease P protein component